MPPQLDSSIIIHLDYDAFYASVFEAETPLLKTRPLAVQQKQIVVTCNYEARRRGLRKLQLIKDAKRICPDVVIVLGEDLSRFRDASKGLYAYLRSFSWNQKCQRLGFDEVWMDVSDIIDYNIHLLNPNNLARSFFCLSKTDPTAGFPYDASQLAGQAYPDSVHPTDVPLDSLRLRLHLGSHFALHLREKLETEKGFTCTAGISTNKLLSKLVGNLHKPKDQTTLLPPYHSEGGSGNVTAFINDYEVGKIPGIGFKLAQKLRAHVLDRQAAFEDGLVYGGTKESVLVGQIKQLPNVGADALEKILGGSGTPHGIGARVWGLLNGCDETEVGRARNVPTQISIEDSYIRLDTLNEVTKELLALSKNLLKRMHADLLDDDEDDEAEDEQSESTSKRWLAFPKSLRLSTRPRPPRNPDGSRNRSFARISRSGPMPNFVFNLKESTDHLAERLVREALLPLFKRLHPEKSGWNLSLVNVAATNMVDSASEKGGVGRDIGKMFKRQDGILKQFTVYDHGSAEPHVNEQIHKEQAELDAVQLAKPPSPRLATQHRMGSEDIPTASQEANCLAEDRWESDSFGDNASDADGSSTYRCEDCGTVMPIFAMGAHARWHA